MRFGTTDIFILGNIGVYIAVWNRRAQMLAYFEKCRIHLDSTYLFVAVTRLKKVMLQALLDNGTDANYF